MEAQHPSPIPPVPESNALPRDGGFASSFWSMLPAAMWPLPILAFILLSGEPRRASNWVALAIASALMVACAGMLCFLFRTHVTRDGIHGQDIWGGPRALRWNEVTHIRPRRILNLRYLVLHRERGAPLWLPLFLRDVQGFLEAVHQHAPDHHPLRAVLDLPPNADAAST